MLFRSGKVFSDYPDRGRLLSTSGVWDTLTQREREVLKLVAEGKSNRDMAQFLCLSTKTIEKHRAKLMAKLGMHSAAALTTYAIQKGLVGG